MTHYDLAVIGTGSGNSIVDERFAGRRVAIFEENRFGGTCLNVGCIPTKMFVYPADVARSARESDHLGLDTSYAGARWPEIRDRVFGRVDAIERGGRDYRKGLDGVDVFESHVSFVDDHTLVTSTEDGGTGEQVTADQVVIAAGSRVLVADIPGLEDVPFHTSDTVMRLEELPRRMVVVGGGYVAAEFAHVFSSLGTHVTQVQRGPRLLMAHDQDVSRAFTEAATRQWDVRLDATTTGVARRGDGVVVTLSDGTEVAADVLLVATGRVPNADRLGLEHTGIEVRDGIVVVDEHQRTTVEGVWALGDVSNTHQLKHVANHEARIVQHNLLHPDDLRANTLGPVPSAVFTHPQIASVGLREEDAVDQGLAHRVVRQDYGDVAYGWAMDSQPGEAFLKLVVSADGQTILGAHALGAQASILLQPLVQAMSLGLSPEQVARGQYWIHPSLAEVVENALLGVVS
ncbi:mycothione reductase [Nocardioides scoriae]|uniref:Mycothione reductase n=1 Tax=Nocardioides scoriae TaxID=642780 RepID=A0A1H1WT25_9ACTN|nr:mycothione reductase [Nocardioides scoriae]SDT00202.1 mycothione reductase [Nocardioides scoriae]